MILLRAWRYRSGFRTEGGNTGFPGREFWRGPRGEDWQEKGVAVAGGLKIVYGTAKSESVEGSDIDV